MTTSLHEITKKADTEQQPGQSSHQSPGDIDSEVKANTLYLIFIKP